MCFIALKHYVNMDIASLWRENVAVVLNRASEEGNLTDIDECHVTYVILSHTSGHQHHHTGERVDPSVSRVNLGIQGAPFHSFSMTDH